MLQTKLIFHKVITLAILSKSIYKLNLFKALFPNLKQKAFKLKPITSM